MRFLAIRTQLTGVTAGANRAGSEFVIAAGI
jgi:hypothetical protein